MKEYHGGPKRQYIHENDENYLSPIDFVRTVEDFAMLVKSDHANGCEKTTNSTIEYKNVVIDFLHVIYNHTLK